MERGAAAGAGHWQSPNGDERAAPSTMPFSSSACVGVIERTRRGEGSRAALRNQKRYARDIKPHTGRNQSRQPWIKGPWNSFACRSVCHQRSTLREATRDQLGIWSGMPGRPAARERAEWFSPRDLRETARSGHRQSNELASANSALNGLRRIRMTPCCRPKPHCRGQQSFSSHRATGTGRHVWRLRDVRAPSVANVSRFLFLGDRNAL